MTDLALRQLLVDVARRAEQAGHGRKGQIYAEAAERLGISQATLMRKLAELTPRNRRRRRDAGESALTLEEARTISAYLMDSRRKSGKRLASLEDSVEVLRSNGRIQAGRVDETTGELIPLSLSAISRALYHYRLHPEQLSQPAPKSRLASRHPNHVWQIDPSLCVLYYLPSAQGEALQVMDEAKFYKNKPANIRRIEKERVWRYVITDHASGVIFVHYVLGAESGVNLVEAFIRASQKRHAQDPFHGIPKIAMVDPGSANTGAVFRNLCRALGVHLQVNQPGQPWAKGQVEKANDQVERSFEHRLRFQAQPPTSLEEINTLAEQWMRWFNARRIHSRTGVSRYAAWQRITAEQLTIAPAPQVMRHVAMAAPKARKVSSQLTLDFEGRTYAVGDIPGVMVGEMLLVCRNPWREDVAGVIYHDDEGREVVQLVEAVNVNEWGFADTDPVIGERYQRPADTLADTQRKAVERAAMGAATDEEAAAKRKAGTVPLAGLDPMKPIADTPLPDYLPRRGTDLELDAPNVQALRLNPVEAAKRLRARMGDEWGSQHYAWLATRYPEGVPEDELESIEGAMRRITPTPLRQVGGE